MAGFTFDEGAKAEKVKSPVKSSGSKLFVGEKRLTIQMIDDEAARIRQGFASIEGDTVTVPLLTDNEVAGFVASFRPQFDPASLYLSLVYVHDEEGYEGSAGTVAILEIKTSLLEQIESAAKANDCALNEVVVTCWKEGSGKSTEYKASVSTKFQPVEIASLDLSGVKTVDEFIDEQREAFQNLVSGATGQQAAASAPPQGALTAANA